MCECISIHGKTNHSEDCSDSAGRPRKHAALIKAWADGAAIQRRSYAEGDWFDAHHPTWNPRYEYRVKPITIKYRKFLYRRFGKICVGCHNYSSRLSGPDTRREFIKWIDTEWQEVEV
jgi:hypothetical protein